MNRWRLAIGGWLLAFGFWLLAMGAFAKDIPVKPIPPRLVNDFANILSPEEKNILEFKLKSYFDSTSTQIAVVIENSLDGDEIFDYCQRLATTWGIGEKGKNNGILIYVAIGDKKVRIHTGYGMEATITDALTTRIRHEQINPSFREGKYFEGLNAATDIIMKAASGEYVNDRPVKKKGGGNFGFIIFIIIIMIIMAIFRGRGGRGGFGGGLMGPILWGTFGSGGFSSGGSGGGDSGFGGFGGGGFGGGGSDGGW